MESLWAAQSFQPEHVVLKLKLRPYSCGHEINLIQCGSPFLTGGNLDWHDLFVASLICSQTFDEGQRLIRNPAKVKWFARAWKLILLRSLLLPIELANFQHYLQSGMWTPDTNPATGQGSRTLKAPRVYRLIPFLCAHLHLAESQALDFPMARAHAYYAAQADKAGEIDLAGGSEADALLEHLANLEARAAKGEKVWEF